MILGRRRIEATNAHATDINRNSHLGVLLDYGFTERRPWSEGSAPKDDRNHEERERGREIALPDPDSQSVVDRMFARVDRASWWLWGVRHLLDVYIATDELPSHTNSDGEYDGAFSYEVEIDRLLTALGRDRRTRTKNVLDVLHKVAEFGGKIAFVVAHGDSRAGEAGGEAWIASGGQWARTDEIVRDLAARRTKNGALAYGAIYLSACNPEGVPPDMRGVDVPVIAHLATNGLAAEANTQVFWPDNVHPWGG